MKKTAILFMVVSIAVATGCSTTKKQAAVVTPDQPQKIVIGDNSADSPDWTGVYQGVLPCADCDGLVTTLTLNKDKTFKRVMVYKGKSDQAFEESGKFTWDNTGSVVMLQGITGSPSYYKVGENQVMQLDLQGKAVEGELAEMYILKKTEQVFDPSLTGKKWKLVELNGKPVEQPAGSGKDYYIELDTRETRVNGFAGCNGFFGNYELKAGNRITFTKMGSTLMACPNLSTEQALLKVLETADNYTVNGNRMELNKARMAPLARFVEIGK
ncbi:MAG: copper resistance protein NlpE N-terminal domain-containing protein [Bacteroidales bacterium]|nr:copper resistance protein NlpE N-terminal domain-containing protein [Bacteroidales bacterium]